MLPVKYRLKNKKEFNETFKRGKSVPGNLFLMKFARANGEEKKIGFSVSLKFSKKATERNKIKRWMREAVRLQLGKIKHGRKLIFMLGNKASGKKIDFNAVEKDIAALLRKSNLL